MHVLRIAVLAVCCALTITGCDSKGSKTKQGNAETPLQTKVTDQNASKNAGTYLEALKAGDRSLLYQASNLSSQDVDESRQRLTNTKKYPLTPEQRKETEHALRMSGSIDFYLKKITPLLKHATISIAETTRTVAPRIPMLIHEVKLTYVEKKQAPTDINGRQIKELIFRLNQMEHKVAAKVLHEFEIDNNDFIKMTDRQFNAKAFF